MTRGEKAAPKTLILVVEDDRELQYLLGAVLADEKREILVVGTATEGLEALRDREVSLLILDLILPDADGRTVLSELRARAGTAALPVICVSIHTDPAVRDECYALGADAFVEKPFDPAALASDVAFRLHRAEAHEGEAYRDGLTGLLNRAGFLDALEAVPEGEAHSILMAEMDGFRRLSERFGWGTAERIVCEVASALRKGRPRGASLARWGGSEFAVLFTECSHEEACVMAQDVLEAVRELPVTDPEGESFRVTMSGGLVDAEVADDVVERLDAAQGLLFRARDGGGNRLVTSVMGEAERQVDAPVLVAEDDDITAKILTHRLEKEGFRVLRFSNGLEAYQGALSQTPALVLLDVKMPGMDGFELLERLRKTPAYTRIPIVLLTSMGSEADVIRGFELGADDYVLKPFSPSELVARVRRLVGRGDPAD